MQEINEHIEWGGETAFCSCCVGFLNCGILISTSLSKRKKKMRLIDADALIADINRFTDWDSVDGITATTILKQTITDIRNAPTINVKKKSQWQYVDGCMTICPECGAVGCATRYYAYCGTEFNNADNNY